MKVEDVNRLMKQFEDMQTFMKSMNSRNKRGKRKRLPGLGGMPINPNMDPGMMSNMMHGQGEGKRKK